MAYCRKCGAQISDDSAFCPKCGEKVEPLTEITEKSPKPKKKKGGVIKGFLLSIVIIFIACFGAAIYLSNITGTSEVSNTNTDSWQIYEKKDEFGDIVERTDQTDPHVIAEFPGKGKLSTGVNEYNVRVLVAISDYSLLDHGVGGYLFFIPVFKDSGMKMTSISSQGIIKAKASDGSKLEKTTNLPVDRFGFADSDNFFIEHLKNGEDIQCVAYSVDGTYTFNFTVNSSNFKRVYDELHSGQ